MAFRFSLAAVLKYREELEKREERVLEQRREAIARLEAQLASTQEQRLLIVAERNALLERGTLGDDLLFATEQEQQMKALEETLQKQISEAMREYQEQMKIFLAARQKREVLEELRNTRKETYETEQARREQQTIDEIFGAQFNRDK
jgi:flagellar export protein FliJ